MLRLVVPALYSLTLTLVVLVSLADPILTLVGKSVSSETVTVALVLVGVLAAGMVRSTSTWAGE